jgi:hypothetical protein
LERQKHDNVIVTTKQIVEEHEQKIITNGISDFISKGLVICPRLQNGKLVLGHSLSHSNIASNLPNHILLVKLVVAHQKVITRFNKALEKNQACNNDV